MLVFKQSMFRRARAYIFKTVKRVNVLVLTMILLAASVPDGRVAAQTVRHEPKETARVTYYMQQKDARITQESAAFLRHALHTAATSLGGDAEMSAQAEQGDTATELVPLITLLPDVGLAYAVAEALHVPSIYTRVSKTDLTEIKQLTYFGTAENKKIKSLTGIEYLSGLRALNLHGHEITDWAPISTLTELVSLELVDNHLSDHDLVYIQQLVNLQQLALYHNDITDVAALSNLVNLQQLRLSTNKIRDITPLTTLNKLTHLWLAANELADLTPVAAWPHLVELDVSNNKIGDISPVSVLTNLTKLDFFMNVVTDISPIISLHKLRQLSIGKAYSWHNNITDFSLLTHLPQLDSLQMQGHDINRIPVEVIMRLKELFVPFSNITDVNVFRYFTHLTVLDLGFNLIADLSPFTNCVLPNLTYLNLAGNAITDLTPLGTLYVPRLVDVHLYYQVPTQELLHYPNLIVANEVRDTFGQLIIPNSIEPRWQGRYENDLIIWTIPMPIDEASVSYTWTKQVLIGHTIGLFSGEYTITAHAHCIVKFIFEEETFSVVDILAETFLIMPDKAPEKAGYKFIGWFTEPVGGRKWDAEQDLVHAGRLELYAQFEPLETGTGEHDEGEANEDGCNAEDAGSDDGVNLGVGAGNEAGAGTDEMTGIGADGNDGVSTGNGGDLDNGDCSGHEAGTERSTHAISASSYLID
jgi:internalin A